MPAAIRPAPVELIDFTDASPRWQIVGSILQPLSTTKAVLLPDGKVLIGQGVNRSPNCVVDGRPCTFEEKEGHHFQMFDPATGSIRKLGKTTVSRGLHGTATLLRMARCSSRERTVKRWYDRMIPRFR